MKKQLLRMRPCLQTYLLLLSLIICFFSTSKLHAQSLSLEDCYTKTEKNYPLVHQLDLLNLSEKYNLENAARSWIPQFNLWGKASYQTEVVSISLPAPIHLSINMPQDQYQIGLQLNQILWDGGQISAARKSIKANYDILREQNKIDLYALRSRINDLYFGIILYDAQISQIHVSLDELQRNYNDIENYIKQGVANQGDLDAVKAELFSARQTMIQAVSMRKAYVDMLSVFLGESLSSDFLPLKPEEISMSNENKRYELGLFDAHIRYQEAQKAHLLAKNMPQISLYIQGAYAQPGLNMFKSGFSPYAIGGLQLNWNFGNLYTLKNDKDLLSTNIKSTEINRQVFLLNTSVQARQQMAQAEQYRKILETDNEIIEMRNNIYRISSEKTKHGTLSVTDLMRDFNQKQSAEASKIIHEVQYIKSIYDLRNTNNN